MISTARGRHAAAWRRCVEKVVPRLNRQCAGRDHPSKPLPPAPLKRRPQREFLVVRDPAVQPRSSIAEALAAVLAPSAAPPPDIVGGQLALAPLRRPAKLTSGPAPPLLGEHPFEAAPCGIAGAQPDKMEQLVYKDPGELPVRAIEGDAALAKEGTGVHRAVPVTQPRLRIDPDWCAGHRWQAPQQCIGLLPRERGGKYEETGTRHSPRI